MFFKKKKKGDASPRHEAISFIQKAQEFEKSQIEAVKRNNKLAWRVTGASMLLAVLSVGAVIGLTPLKTVEPFVLRVDNNTGATDVVTSVRDIKPLKFDEAIDKFWLSQYVRYREGYDWWTVQPGYDASMLMSSPHIQNDIGAFFESAAAPYKVLKDKARVDIRVISISFFDSTAQIRFEKRVKFLAGDQSNAPAPQRLLATVAYRYVNKPITEKDRLVNPLGFQVMSYRVDPEAVTTQ
ncbi:type IV secretion system protein VirB8 [Advenella incenata]|uniref:Type IV secretion system protein VirB8 n=1 Tax=Advenella incenata TaxID=267800 RepID=A0A4Q7V8X0_9BURK|nr:type IV secretion system protein [Advenella incenata]RZT91058.1 type IV secretion system protein VirB8 [Advenella incenata]